MNTVNVSKAQIKYLVNQLSKPHSESEIDSITINDNFKPTVEHTYVVNHSSVNDLVTMFKNETSINHVLTWDEYVDFIVITRFNTRVIKTTMKEMIIAEIDKGTPTDKVFEIVHGHLKNELIDDCDDAEPTINIQKELLTTFLNEVIDEMGDLKSHINVLDESNKDELEVSSTNNEEVTKPLAFPEPKIDSTKAESIKKGGKEFIESPIAIAMREEMQLWVDDGETISFAWKMALLVARYHIIRSVQRAKESQWNTGMYALKTRNLSAKSKEDLAKALKSAKEEALATTGVSL